MMGGTLRQLALGFLVFLLSLDSLSNRNLHTVMIENVSLSFPSVPSALCIFKVVDIWSLFSPFTTDICSCSKYHKAFLISRGAKVYILGYKISPPSPKEGLFMFKNKRSTLSLNSGRDEDCVSTCLCFRIHDFGASVLWYRPLRTLMVHLAFISWPHEGLRCGGIAEHEVFRE